ncbi:putative GMC-type oxidoreductase [BD1-7 clade bacterium]|uniref:Putative GMC-type oxidoreductase n=1 Tax=BD1-7 clade bacterium TaxID=2029982 RepID=A0A5S9N6F2_9GAMM|nr:putative GMC-type oxidoreductase [BD1-7 clade bacterium]CAA0084531.1 putative GMC-type oxidoreductase [BD1-7 clade bacterium]
MENTVDFIIVGAGSAGSALAGELARRSDATILVIESGPAAERNPETLSADGFKYCFANDNVIRDRFSEKLTGLNGRSAYQGTGWTAGGSGAVNGMVYTPGDAKDFNSWPAGWQWQDVSPVFKRLEAALQPQAREATSFTQAAIDAGNLSGFAHKNGLMDGNLKGFIGHNAMNYQGDKRQSSYQVYLHQANLPHLELMTETLVHRVLIEDGKAVGVEVEQYGRRQRIYTNKEVILAAGALETPKLLMLSGVGPATVLDQFSIEPKLIQPAIGQNLHDHPNVCMFFRGKQKTDFGYPQLYAFDRVNALTALPAEQPDTCFAFFSAPITLHQSMLRMVPTIVLPKILYSQKAARTVVRSLVNLAFKIPPLRRFVDQIYGIVVILGKPESRGSLTLRSSDARDQAIINPAYYEHPDDLLTMINGVKRAQQIASQTQMQAWGNQPLSAGAKTTEFSALKQWIASATMTTFHFCGTCMMGDSDDAPVNPRLHLKGIDGLRIADASVIPEVPVSAINAPSMMIGLRAADFIIDEHGLQQTASTSEPSSTPQTASETA